MSTYREIHGKAVKSVSTDPSAETDAGQIWYNTASDTFKSIVKTAAWSTAAPISTARSNAGGFGIQTANVIAGGSLPSGKTNLCEEYNGSGWATGGVLNTTRGELSGVTSGTLTAGLMFGGNTAPGWNGTTATEEYNGTAWTSVNNMATTVSFMGGSGIQTAAFSAGGRVPANTNNSQEYDGTNWSNGNPINTARQGGVGTGIQTAGLYCGGEASGASADVESYDGTTWTEGPNLGTARYRLGGGGDTQNTSMVFAGSVPGGASKVLTELYDGTSWSETADMGSTAKEQVSGFRGPNTAGIATGGYINSPPGWASTSEEFNQGTNVITAAAWASAPTLPIAVNSIGGLGTQTAALGYGGYVGPTVASVFSYNGTSWSPAPSLGTARYGAGGNGSTTAGLVYGGSGLPVPSAPVRAETEEFNGSSWSEQNNLSTARSYVSGFGTQTAGVAVTGASPRVGPAISAPNSTEEYDGSSWTAGGDLNTTRYKTSCAGQAALTAGVAFGGYNNPPASMSQATEEYNGTAWTSVNNMLTNLAWHAAQSSGTQTDSLIFGGYSSLPFSVPTLNTTSFAYDGTNFSTRAALGTPRGALGGAGATSTSALAIGGNPNTNKTEEFTGETTSLNVKTLTQS